MKRRSFLAMVASLPFVPSILSAAPSAPYVGKPFLSVVMTRRAYDEVCFKLPPFKKRVKQLTALAPHGPQQTEMVEVIVPKPSENPIRPIGLPMGASYSAHSIMDLETQTLLKSRDQQVRHAV